MKLSLASIFFFLFSWSIKAESDRPFYIPEERLTFTTKENLVNFGTVYGAQWTYYLIGQKKVIQDYGSLENWYKHPFSPHFDKDSFDYNIFKHSLTGNFYYLWYRSRGHTERSAFAWSVVSSLAFEFTIETITERPSYQDIYQTPVFGAVLGIGVEKASRYMHSLGTWYGHTMGYILNPFTLIPVYREEELVAMPIINQDSWGFAASYRY